MTRAELRAPTRERAGRRQRSWFGRRQQQTPDVIAGSGSASRPQQRIYPWMNQIGLSWVSKGLPVSGSACLSVHGHLGAIRSRFVPPALPLPRYAVAPAATAAPAPACSHHSVCRRHVPRSARRGVNPKPPRDLENCTPGQGCGSRSKGWFSEPLTGHGSPSG